MFRSSLLHPADRGLRREGGKRGERRKNNVGGVKIYIGKRKKKKRRAIREEQESVDEPVPVPLTKRERKKEGGKRVLTRFSSQPSR